MQIVFSRKKRKRCRMEYDRELLPQVDVRGVGWVVEKKRPTRQGMFRTLLVPLKSHAIILFPPTRRKRVTINDRPCRTEQPIYTFIVGFSKRIRICNRYL